MFCQGGRRPSEQVGEAFIRPGVGLGLGQALRVVNCTPCPLALKSGSYTHDHNPIMDTTYSAIAMKCKSKSLFLKSKSLTLYDFRNKGDLKV